MTIRIDRAKCSGIGLCEMVAPSVFEIGGDGQSHVLDETPVGADHAAVEEAISNCPTGALSIGD